MKKQTAEQQKAFNTFMKVLYGYIGFVFLMVFLDTFGVFHPVPDILAAIALLVGCYNIGKYGRF